MRGKREGGKAEEERNTMQCNALQRNAMQQDAVTCNAKQRNASQSIASMSELTSLQQRWHCGVNRKRAGTLRIGFCKQRWQRDTRRERAGTFGVTFLATTLAIRISPTFAFPRLVVCRRSIFVSFPRCWSTFDILH